MSSLHLAIAVLLQTLPGCIADGQEASMMRRHGSKNQDLYDPDVAAADALLNGDIYDPDVAAADALLNGVQGHRSKAPEAASLLETDSFEQRKQQLVDAARLAIRKELSVFKQHFSPAGGRQEVITPPSLLQVGYSSREMLLSNEMRDAAHEELVELSKWAKKEADPELADDFLQATKDAEREAKAAEDEADEMTKVGRDNTLADLEAGLPKTVAGTSFGGGDFGSRQEAFAFSDPSTAQDASAFSETGEEIKEKGTGAEALDSSALKNAESGNMEAMHSLAEALKLKTSAMHKDSQPAKVKALRSDDDILNNVINWNNADTLPEAPKVSPGDLAPQETASGDAALW